MWVILTEAADKDDEDANGDGEVEGLTLDEGGVRGDVWRSDVDADGRGGGCRIRL